MFRFHRRVAEKTARDKKLKEIESFYTYDHAAFLKKISALRYKKSTITIPIKKLHDYYKNLRTFNICRI